MARTISIFFFILMIGVILSITASPGNPKKTNLKGTPQKDPEQPSKAENSNPPHYPACTLPSGDGGYCVPIKTCGWTWRKAGHNLDHSALKSLVDSISVEARKLLNDCNRIQPPSPELMLICCAKDDLRPDSVDQSPGPSRRRPARPNRRPRPAAA